MATYADPSVISINQTGRSQPGALLALGAGIVAVVVAGLFFLQITLLNSQKADLQKQVDQNQQALAGEKTVTDRLANYNTWAGRLHTVFDSQKDWDKTFAALESHLYKKMKLTTLTVSSKGEVELSGTVPGYTDYALFYAGLSTPTAGGTQPYFADVRPTSVTKTADGVQFTVKATIVPVPIMSSK